MKYVPRGFILKKRLEEIFCPFAHGVNDSITPCCFDHIRNDKCPNDSRRFMALVASVPFWFLAGNHIFSIIYPVVIDF